MGVMPTGPPTGPPDTSRKSSEVQWFTVLDMHLGGAKTKEPRQQSGLGALGVPGVSRR
jgi:hypothetical protein